jgi:hypothetical protein
MYSIKATGSEQALQKKRASPTCLLANTKMSASFSSSSSKMAVHKTKRHGEIIKHTPGVGYDEKCGGNVLKRRLESAL